MKMLFSWYISVITNLKNIKLICISENADTLDNARLNLTNRILILQKYGISCYKFKENQYDLTLYKNSILDKEYFTEYYIIEMSFLKHIQTQKPIITYESKNYDSKQQYTSQKEFYDTQKKY